MPEQFDLIVIGGGSGGLAAAQRAAAYGAKVAVIEMGRLGGTCVNVGCIPKKISWNAANLAELQHISPDYGFSWNKSDFNFNEFVSRREQFIAALNHTYELRLKRANIGYIKGTATFAGKDTITVASKTYKAQQIIIATGCQPDHPGITGAEYGIDSDGFFKLRQLPKKIAIIGAGYIAVEMAGILHQLGSEVKILLRHDRPLRHFDALISESVMANMLQQGIEVLPFHEPESIQRNGRNTFIIQCRNNKHVKNIDSILFAIGRSPRTQALNLAAAGVKTGKDGFIRTNKWETTSVPNIHAIGDITGKKMLTPVAIAAGRRLADRLFGGDTKAHLDYRNIPTVIFSHPPVGSVGLTEQEAVDKYGKSAIKIYDARYDPLFYALSSKKIPVRMKLVTLKPKEKILGCHIAGMGADEILQGFAVAIKMGARKKDFDSTVAIHPTIAEELVTMK